MGYENLLTNKIYQSGLLMVKCHESYKEIKNWLGKIAKDNVKYQSK